MTADVLTREATPPEFLWRLRSLIGGGKKRMSAAYEARRRYQELSDRDLRDVGLSREDVLGLPRYQPDLPFFMQPNFDAHRT